MLWHKCRCGTLIPQGIAQCPACAQGAGRQMSRHMEYNLFRRNKKTAQFYVSKEWRAMRSYILSRYDGLDLYAFHVQHRIATADMVHHIVEIEDDWNRRLDPLNLFPLSNSNHGIISALYDKDEDTKHRTQIQLQRILQTHWEPYGGIKKVFENPV